MVELPASLERLMLEIAELPWGSRGGRGILEAGLLLKAGMAERPWLRFGVPRIVPLEEAMMRCDEKKQ
jgi:hypothetical protein